MIRLGIVTSHPIQYYAPWFRQVATRPELQVKVFYLWDFGITRRVDPGFGQSIAWDVDLLEGYDHTFVRNLSKRPGTNSFLGLVNPGLGRSLDAYEPDALLVLGYAQATLLWLCLTTQYPFLLRGDSHSLAAPPTSSGFKTVIRRRVLQRASGHLAVGRANRQWLAQQGVPEDLVFDAPHSVDRVRFQSAVIGSPDRRSQIRRTLSVSDEEVLFGFVGKLEEKKQPLSLIKAFRQAGLDRSRLMIVGSGALEAQVDLAAQEDHRIQRLPFVNQSEMPFIHDAIDVLVLPSQGPYETWGLVVNEAQSIGKPVIVSDHVGCHPDLVIQGETGWVFPAGDVSALSRALQEAAADRERLARMGGAAKALSDRYSFDAATAGLMRALERVVGR